eukprot:1384501-Amorphochlora_amoeboformis.AAC.2
MRKKKRKKARLRSASPNLAVFGRFFSYRVGEGWWMTQRVQHVHAANGRLVLTILMNSANGSVSSSMCHRCPFQRHFRKSYAARQYVASREETSVRSNRPLTQPT